MASISIDDSGHIDQLGRVAFARHLLEIAMHVDASNSGAVLGLEGAWGSGKTRVLRSLESLIEEIDEEEKPVLVRFNPWMISGTQGLVAALLLQMAAEVGQGTGGTWFKRFFRRAGGPQGDFKALSASLVNYARVLSQVKNFANAADMMLPGSGAFLNGIGNASKAAEGVLKKIKDDSTQLSLSDSKKRVETLIKKIDRKVLVLIDDLDRLPPIEIVSMIQAVKAVGDFSNVIYVLSYDPVVASKAIESALVIENGQQFLEKIVQLQLPLPEVPASKMNLFASKRLRSALDLSHFSSTISDDVEKALKLAAAAMATPRDIERLRTRLLVASGVIQDEINYADFILLEVLALKTPALIEWLEQNVTTLMYSGIKQFDENISARGQLGRSTIDHGIESTERKKLQRNKEMEWRSLLIGGRERVAISNLMKFLFDKCKDDWENKETRIDYRRVQNYRYWYKWRCYHDHHESWTVAELQSFLNNPRDMHDQRLTGSNEPFRDVCQQICDVGVGGFVSVDAPAYINVFTDTEVLLGSEAVLEFDVGYGPLQAIQVGLRLADEPARIQALKNAVDSGSVWLAGAILVAVARDQFGGDSQRFSEQHVLKLKDADYNSLRESWFKKVSQMITPGSWFGGPKYYTPYTLLSWMNSMRFSIFQIQSLAQDLIDGNVKNLEILLAEFNDVEAERFPHELRMQLLPRVDRVLELALTSSTFVQDFSKLIKLLKPIAQEEKQGHQQGVAALVSLLKQIK